MVKVIYQIIIVSALLLLTSTQYLSAASVSASYVTPFPEGGKYKVLIIGDTFAEGAALGISKAFQNNPKIELYREIHYRSGIMDTGKRNWLNKVEIALSKRSYDIAVVMLGFRDRRKYRIKGKQYSPEDKEWQNQYKKRMRQALRLFAQKRVAVYWAGMPIVRNDKLRLTFETINQLAKVQTAGAQMRFLDHWLHFSNENGLYTQYGPDISGKIRLLRPKDGIFFTRAGYEKLGFFIQKYIQRDLRDAKAERNIPLLGDEADQVYLLRRFAQDNPRRRRGKTDTNKDKAFKAIASKTSLRSKYESAKHSTIKLSADKSYSGKEVELKIIRPAIPAAAFTINRRVANEQDKDQTNKNLMLEKQSTFLNFSIASNIQRATSDRDQRRIPLTQTPYYKLVVRGDSQLSKPGRADDFTWKRAADKVQEKPGK